AQAFAAERLALDHGADLVAVDVEIADPGMLLDIIADRVDPALKAKRQPVAGRVDLIDDLIEAVAGEPDDVQYRTKILAFQLAYRLKLIKSGSDEAAVGGILRQRQLADLLGIFVEPFDVL